MKRKDLCGGKKKEQFCHFCYCFCNLRLTLCPADTLQLWKQWWGMMPKCWPVAGRGSPSASLGSPRQRWLFHCKAGGAAGSAAICRLPSAFAYSLELSFLEKLQHNYLMDLVEKCLHRDKGMWPYDGKWQHRHGQREESRHKNLHEDSSQALNMKISRINGHLTYLCLKCKSQSTVLSHLGMSTQQIPLSPWMQES